MFREWFRVDSMKHGVKAWICLASGLTYVLATVLPAHAVTADNPYQRIIERNVFGLKDPPPPPDPEATKPPPPNITLTGIITLGGKRALMTTPPVPGKPGEQPKGQSYILREGEREGDIEVISIDEVAGAVVVKNGGKEVPLNFKDNGPKIPSGAPIPVGLPAGLPGAVPAPPNVNPVAAPAGGMTPASPFSKPLPNRNLRLPPSPPTGSPGAGMPMQGYPGGASAFPGAMPNQAGVMPPGQATPTATLPGFTPVQGQPAIDTSAMPTRQYSLEEQAILIEANRQNSPFGGMLPPTALSPKANIQQDQQPAQNPNLPPQQQQPRLPIPGRPF